MDSDLSALCAHATLSAQIFNFFLQNKITRFYFTRSLAAYSQAISHGIIQRGSSHRIFLGIGIVIKINGFARIQRQRNQCEQQNPNSNGERC